MAEHKIAVVAASEPDLHLVEAQLADLDYELDVTICKSDGETIEAIQGAHVIINMLVPMERHVIEQIDTAQAVVSLGHGFDRIDHEAATDQGVMVVNGAGFCSEEVSNHTIMFLLACAKHLTHLHNKLREGDWGIGSLSPMPPIDGQTLGIVGLGNIARATARKAKVFGLEVIAYDPYVQPWISKEYRVEMVASLEELASMSDFVSVLVPLNNETRGMIGEPFFKAMKPTAYFVNTCRGAIVDEGALVRALQTGDIAGAALDVFEQEPTPADNPLLNMDNVIVTPHSAGASAVSFSAGLARQGEETARILRGTWPMSLVNPDVRANIPTRSLPVNP